MRVTQKFLREYVDEINEHLEKKISIRWAYDRPRIFSEDGSVEISGRLPNVEMFEFLNGFMRGFVIGFDQAHKEE